MINVRMTSPESITVDKNIFEGYPCAIMYLHQKGPGFISITLTESQVSDLKKQLQDWIDSI